ncbi:hypothetical protein ACFYYN_14575 [Streptomyces sp. NPDC001902]
MGTDIHGGIEFRHPLAGTEFYEGEPWVDAMDLWPLYDEVDYPSFGYLFGVRNTLGFRPLAAGWGLPEDLSGRFREGLAPWVASGAMDGAGWVTWAELAAADRAAVPEHFVGRVTWRRPSQRDRPAGASYRPCGRRTWSRPWGRGRPNWTAPRTGSPGAVRRGNAVTSR